MLPSASVARTSKVCGPTARPTYAGSGGSRGSIGDSQAMNAAPSREHSNEASISLAEKVNVAFLLVVGLVGLELIVVSGGTATVQMYSAGVSSTTACAFLATTSNVCSPSIRLK